MDSFAPTRAASRRLTQALLMLWFGLMVAVPLTVVSSVATAPSALADAWRDKQNWITDYGFDKAWETTRGAGVTVAIIDTGVDPTHPDLAGNVVGGKDMSGTGAADGTGPMDFDPHHGTMVASLLAGHGNNLIEIARQAEQNAYRENAPAAEPTPGQAPAAGSNARAQNQPEEATASGSTQLPEQGPGPDGIIGTAPEADILTVSVNLDESLGTESHQQQIADGIIWAVDQGAEVINISLTSSEQDWPVSWDEAFKYAEDHDVVVVAAAGNRLTGSDLVGAPATIPGVLTVAGVDESGQASWEASTEGITVGVAAQADPLVGATRDGGYTTWSGTSGAAPIVAGLAALIRSAHPELDAANVINRILVTADDAGEPGTDPLYGHGIINAHAAVTEKLPLVAENPMGSLAEWIRIHRRGSLDETAGSSAGSDAGAGELHGLEPGSLAYPTALPGEELSAAERAALTERSGTGWQPVIIFGGLALIIIAVVALIRARRLSRNASPDQFSETADSKDVAGETS